MNHYVARTKISSSEAEPQKSALISSQLSLKSGQEEDQLPLRPCTPQSDAVMRRGVLM
jgi:hypothetical protein